ncbi:MAG: hypothetical protein QOE70_1101 [Chthoniobacter sp.]|jgi:hypothetical protein|nr:hypothetical protein [Chthoniobacter sp.]
MTVARRSSFLRCAAAAGWTFAWLVALVCGAWAFGALHYDFPVVKSAAAWAFLICVIAAVVFLHGGWRKLGAVFAAFALVLAWWFTLKATNEANWQPDVAQLGWAEINGDEVTLHNVRNCDYRTEMDYTPRWETRTVRLSQITALDLAINYWGSPWMAHPIASFQFADAPPVCFSIETRKKAGQSYSAIGGLYRQFELIYIVADERDVIRVRTNYRQGEDIYLYRTSTTPAQARERFHEYLRSLNQIRDHPRWYNAITTNCTTNIRDQHPAAERIPWDWRLLLNGKADELMFERHTIVTAGLPFAELKPRALINAAAKAANDAPDFSARIRAGVPGF